MSYNRSVASTHEVSNAFSTRIVKTLTSEPASASAPQRKDSLSCRLTSGSNTRVNQVLQHFEATRARYTGRLLHGLDGSPCLKMDNHAVLPQGWDSAPRQDNFTHALCHQRNITLKRAMESPSRPTAGLSNPLPRVVSQELGKRRRHSSCLTPCVGLIGCNQRFSEGDCASRSEHPRPLALPGECSRDKAGASRAFASASCQRSSAASSLHRPPVSIATTTSRHRLEVNSSGYVASFSQRAWTSTAASSPILRRSAYLAWIRGWSRMLAVSCGSFRPLDGVASSLRFAGH